MASAKLFQLQFLKLTVSKPTATFYPCITSVRWRKPRWIPKAPSKEFYVRPEKTYILSPEEEAKLRRSYDLYRNEVAAIRQHLAQQLEAKESQGKKVTVQTDDDWNTMVKMMNQWNNKVAIIRERRQIEEEKEDAERLKQVQEEQQVQVLRMMTEAEEKVTFEKKQKFISLDNLDEEIEKILDVKIDYEYAIDDKGHRHTSKGREPLPAVAKKKKSQLSHS